MVWLLVGGVDVLVAGRRSQVFDEGAFTLVGIDINTYKVRARSRVPRQDCTGQLASFGQPNTILSCSLKRSSA
jgi:hypothetical protein